MKMKNCHYQPLLKYFINAPLIYIGRKTRFSKKDLQRGALKITKRLLVTYLIAFLVLSGTGLVFLFNPWSVKETEAAWFNDSWGFRKSLKINESQVSGSSNLTNFPVLVSISGDSSLTANAQADGDDIRFVTQTGEVLAHEIESYSSGTLVAWVQIPSLSATTDTMIYMYYGNPTVSGLPTAIAQSVWDSDYKMVHHLEESAACDTTFTDSTFYGTDGSCSGSGPAADSDAKIGAGRDFDGTDDEIDPADSSIFDLNATGQYTWEVWVEPDDFEEWNTIYQQTDGTNQFVINAHTTADGTWGPVTAGITVGWGEQSGVSNNLRQPSTDNHLSTNTFAHIVVTYDGTQAMEDRFKIYINGTDRTDTGDTYTEGSLANLTPSEQHIGGASFDTENQDGAMDEFRFSHTLRSTDWIITSYNNQNAPGTFITTGSEEKGTAPLMYWKFNEGYGTTANSAVSGGLNGALSNSSSGGPIKINDAANFGAIASASRQIVRTSSGTLYIVLNRAGSCEVWMSTDGTSWTEQDSSNNPACFSTWAVALAIDSDDMLHIAYVPNTDNRLVRYISFDTTTNLFNASETTNIAYGGDGSADGFDIAVDSNNKPHIAASGCGGSGATCLIRYVNKVTGSWSSIVTAIDFNGLTTAGVSITIDNNNIPQISAPYGTTLRAAIGNANNAASFTSQDVDASISSPISSIAVDSSGNTWIAYIDENGGTDYVSLVKHNNGDSWSTWQSPINNTNAGTEPSIAISGSNVYVFYEDENDDIKYDMYNGSSWLGETNLQTGTYQDVKVKWSYNFNNSTSTLDYLFSDNSDVYWASLALTSATPPDWQTEDQCIAGKCLYFDGTNNENVSKSDDSRLDFAATDSFTLSAWAKKSGSSSAINYLISKADTTTGGYKLWMDADGDYCFGIDDDGTSFPDVSTCTTNANFDDGSWHFVTGVRNTSEDKIYIYVDGKEYANQTDSTTTTLANDNSFYVGVDRDGVSNEWLGFIDEVKVYNFALSLQQILSNFNARSNPEGLSTVLGANTQNMPGALSNGLVGYWKMDENADNSCSGGTNDYCDSSGNLNDGEQNGGVSLVAGKFGNAVSFDGSDDYIEVADDDSLDPSGDWTIAGWFMDTNADLNHAETTLISKGSIGGLNGNVNYYAGIYFNNFVVCYSNSFSCSPGGGGTTTLSHSISSFSANTWIHYSATYKAATRTLTLFLNGSQVASQSFAIANITSSSNNVSIGANGTGSNWEGYQDDVRIYNRALSSAEISQLYNWAPGPAIYLKLDENTGTTAYDSSGNGKYGTLGASSAAPTWTKGKFGGGLDFDNTNDVLEVTTPALPTRDFTYEAWIKTDSNDGMIFGTENDGGSDEDELNIDISGSSTLDVRMNTTSVIAGTATISNGVWYHIAVSRSGSDVRSYINGILDGSGTHGTVLDFVDAACELVIGADPADDCPNDTYARFFDGLIDDVKVYNYARTPAQIIEDMNAGHPAPGSPVGTPVGWWKFNEGVDNTCSGGSNDVCNSGNGGTTYDGTSTASRTNAGRFARALDFDGSDDVVTITNNAAIDMDGNLANFTFSAWVYADSDGESDTGQIFSKGSSTYLRVDSQDGSNNLDLECNLDRATTDTNVNVADAFTTASWNYVACSWNGTTLSVYVNGKLRGSSNSGSGAISSDSNNLLIGGGTSNNFDGKIDEFKVYNSALTAGQIPLDMNQGSAQVLGTLSSSQSQPQGASAEYCIPGDSSTCTAPVGRWDFEEGTGTTAYDTSGNNFNASLNGSPIYGRGKTGKAVDFDGSNDYAVVTDNATLRLSSLTVELWMKADTPVSNSFAFLLGKQTASTDRNYAIFMNNTGVVSASSSFNAQSDISSSTDIDDGQWHHVAYTVTGNTQRIYVDGALKNTVTSSAGAIDQSTGNLIINDATDSLNFDGQIDQIRIFNYARTPAQIAWDYNNGKPIAHWKMDECQGTTINDSSGNGHTGTWNGSGSGTNTAVGTCSTAGTAWGDGVTGKFNSSLDFDGTDDYVVASGLLGLNSATSGSRNVTLTAWVNLTNADTNGGEIVSIGDYVNLRADDSCGGVSAGFYQGSGDWMTFCSNRDIDDTGWHFVAFVFDDTNDVQNLYIDMIVPSGGSGTDTDTIRYDLSLGTDTYIGKHGDGDTSVDFQGRIDDVRVYNYPLTTAQLKMVMNEGAVRFGPSSGTP